MSTVKPEDRIGYRQHGALAERLDERGVDSERFNRLFEHPDETIALIDLLGAEPEKIKVELARMMVELKSLLPLFAERLAGWKVDEDLGGPLPDDWDPRPFLDGLMVGCVHPDGAEYMKGEDLVTEARKRLAGRGGFSQHELDWFYRHWDDVRIPDWFRQAVEEEDPEKRIFLVATETILLSPDGNRAVLCLCWYGGRLRWGGLWLDGEDWGRGGRVLVPGDSSV